MKSRLNTLIQLFAITGAISTLIGCAATQTALEHHNLETNTQLSKTIFLDPVASSQKTVFIAVKNTSQEQLSIEKPLAQALKDHGYRVVNNPSIAHYMIQANILKIGKMSISASQSALGGGYGSAIAGAVAGTALGTLTNHTSGMIVGGLSGGLLGVAADSLVKDVNYTMITDVQISERAGKGIKINEQFQSHLKNGTGSVISQTSLRDSQYQRYRTRIVSNADKVNLKFADARPALEQGLVKTITGIF